MQKVETSEIKYLLFLSMDITGSTEFKYTHNISKNYLLLEERNSFIDKLLDQLKSDSDISNISTKYKINIHEKIKETTRLPEIQYSDLDILKFDWRYRFEDIFNSFIEYFNNAYNQQMKWGKINIDTAIWKNLGDELIFKFEITSPEQIFKYVTAFSVAIRRQDRNLLEQKTSLRLKGTVWGAEFPIRNKEIKIGNSINDFLGPDIDIGFRLGKETWPGLITSTLDIIYLLGKINRRPKICCKLVGYKKLKGVWGESPYPIFWIKADKNYFKNRDDYEYKECNEIDKLKSPYVQKYLDEKFESQQYFDQHISEALELSAIDTRIKVPFIPDPNNLSTNEEYLKHLKLYNDFTKHTKFLEIPQNKDIYSTKYKSINDIKKDRF